MRNIALASIILATISCNQPENTTTNPTVLTAEPAKIQLPNTPETVVRAWEEAVNKNQYSFAQMMSAGPQLDFVKTLAESNDIEQSLEMRSEIINLTCTEQGGDAATCNCTIKYDDGEAAFRYYLVRNNGQWLVNDVMPEEVQPNSRMNQKPSRPVK